MNCNDMPRMLAFYLPQFHQTPENDKWWGAGYTEWNNVINAHKLFWGHNQPRVPLDNNYYCLDNQKVMEWQAQLARQYGIYGFCYYHYWFGKDRKLLYKPLEAMLDNNKVDIPYCMCWANEPWTRIWYGGNYSETLMDIDYGDEEEWSKHIEYLIPFFKDDRYIKVNNKPMFLIYRIGSVVNGSKMIRYWKKRLIEEGFDGIYLLGLHNPFVEPQNSLWVDGMVDFEPHKTTRHNIVARQSQKLMDVVTFRNKHDKIKHWPKYFLNILDYDETNRRMIERKHNKRAIRGVFVDFDNSPRAGKNAVIVKGSSPDKFQKYLMKQLELTINEGKQYLFINAWNEWGESAYLEPDEKNGYAYLEAVKQALFGIEKD